MFPSKTTAERRADFLVHAFGLAFLLPASVLLIPMAAENGNALLLPGVMVYAAAALFSIGISFAYHLLPVHAWRATLRRFDHAAIYTAIAGVFTPLLIVSGTTYALVIGAALWVFAVAGAVFKLAGGNADSRWSLFSYLGLTWFALLAIPDFWIQLPHACALFIGLGAAFYMVGSIFYSRKQMPFRYPIWHAVGTCGGVSCFFANWIAVTG